MHKLKSDIIHALQSVPMSTDKLVEVSNICDAYAKLVEENGSSHNKQMLSASQINHALKNMESDEQRLDFLSECFSGICRHCGSVTDVCYCMRDD